MSTRATIYYRPPSDGFPHIHVYREYAAVGGEKRLEISTEWVTINVPLPEDLWDAIIRGLEKKP